VRVNAVNPATVATQLHIRAGMSEEKCRQYWQNSSAAHPLGHLPFFPPLFFSQNTRIITHWNVLNKLQLTDIFVVDNSREDWNTRRCGQFNFVLK
jgi:hypothetical protein